MCSKKKLHDNLLRQEKKPLLSLQALQMTQFVRKHFISSSLENCVQDKKLKITEVFLIL
jgi:hypothetical protein